MLEVPTITFAHFTILNFIRWRIEIMKLVIVQLSLLYSYFLPETSKTLSSKKKVKMV